MKIPANTNFEEGAFEMVTNTYINIAHSVANSTNFKNHLIGS